MPIAFMKPHFFAILMVVPLIWISLWRMSDHQPKGAPKWVAGGFRTLLAVLLAVALADPRLAELTDRVNLFYCLDLSDSVAKDQIPVAEEFIAGTSAVMDAEDRAGLIVFGESPSVEIDLRHNFRPDLIRSEVNRHFTDAARAIQIAIGSLPQDGKRRIVLLTDGNTPSPALMDAAYAARSMGVEIFPVPLDSWYGENEVYIPSLRSPEITPLETPFNIEVTVLSASSNEGELVVLRNNALFAREAVALKPGKNIFRFTDMLKTPGLFLYKAVINAREDTVYENNENFSFTRGTRKSSVLYVAPFEKKESPILRALRQQGIAVVHHPIHTLDFKLRNLTEHHCVILDNVPSHALSLPDMDRLHTYVRDLGGGLIMIGGEHSFGAGKYGKTPVEKALPVSIDMPSQLEYPGLILVLVIDKSSSMTGRLGDETKLEMAKVAAFSAAERLNPVDQLGILAFDMTFKWVVPVTQIKDLKPVAERLSMLAEDGGTTLFPALEEAHRVLSTAEAAKKHVIVLSDGLIEEADFQSLVEAMSRSGITVTTVAIGSDSDVRLMAAIARWGNGRSYFTNKAETVPKIFVDETRIASEAVIIEKNLQPQLRAAVEITNGIDVDDWPAIKGQVVTYAKPGAREILVTDQGPLLAAWQYGLGRSVAFTSDLAERWAAPWVVWEHYGQFVSQMVKWTQRKESDSLLSAEIRRQGEKGVLLVDVTDKTGRFSNLLHLGANVLSPLQKEKQFIALEQIAPGQYRAEFPATQVGEYYFSIYNEADSGVSVYPTVGYAIPYSEEYDNRETNTMFLQKIAALTGGRLLTTSNRSAELFHSRSDVKQYEYQLWPIVAVSFLVLFVMEIAVRKMLALRLSV